jgi:hypothetical protein
LAIVIYDRFEKAKIKWWDSRALLLGALLYFVASRYREIVAYAYEFTIFNALNYGLDTNSYYRAGESMTII